MKKNNNFLIHLLGVIVTTVLFGCSISTMPYNSLRNQYGVKTGHPFDSFSFYTDSTVLYSSNTPFNGVSYGFTEEGYMKDGTRICEDDFCTYDINFKNGKLHGLWRMWTEDGKLVYESNWKKGKLDGLTKGWFLNGRLEWSAKWKDGVKIIGYLYNEDGSVTEF